MLVFYDLRETKARTFNRVMSDANTATGLRHTIDIRSAMATPGDNPDFAPSVKVSDYLMGINWWGSSHRRAHPLADRHGDVARQPVATPTGARR